MLTYYRTAERPDLKFWLEDDDGTLVDLSSDAVELKIGYAGSAAVLTKTITGQSGSGAEPDGTPNAVATFTAGDLDDVAAGRYEWQIKATSGGLDRFWRGPITISDVIT